MSASDPANDVVLPARTFADTAEHRIVSSDSAPRWAKLLLLPAVLVLAADGLIPLATRRNLAAPLLLGLVFGQLALSPVDRRGDRAIWGNLAPIYGDRAIWGNVMRNSRALWGNVLWKESNQPSGKTAGVDMSQNSLVLIGE